MIRKLFFILMLVVGLPGGLIVGWVVLSNASPGHVGTPAHAGAVSNGKPEECTTVNLKVHARSTVSTEVEVLDGQILRGTYEADGGFGRVDIIARVESPNGGEIMVAPRASNYDFVIPIRMGGAYTFTFDNRYSLVTPKAIGLFYCIQK